MHRRQFLLFISVSPLVACANFNNSLASVANDVALIAQGFTGVMPAIDSIPGIPIETIGVVHSAIADLQLRADQIKETASTTEAQPLVQQVEGAFNAIVTALAQIPGLPPVVQIALQAATILLPVIEAAVHLIVSPRLNAQAAGAHLSTDQARALLRDLASEN
jgi:hypothetical protein